MFKYLLRGMTIALFVFTYIRITDNNKLLQYLFMPDDKVAQKDTAKSVAPSKSIPLTKNLRPKK
jgi:hypothetical protein